MIKEGDKDFNIFFKIVSMLQSSDHIIDYR